MVGRRQSLTEAQDPRKASEIMERLAKQDHFVDLSIALLRFQNLPLKPIEVFLKEDDDWRQALLVAPRGKVFLMPDGRRIFDPSSLVDLEEYVSSGMRRIMRLQNDAIWAALVGLGGVFGLIAGSLPSAFQRKRDRADVKRWVDQSGNSVYLAEDPDGARAHLLLVSYDRRYYYMYEPLANALKRAGHYVVRFTYPASLLSWREALGLKVDPVIEVLLDPSQ